MQKCMQHKMNKTQNVISLHAIHHIREDGVCRESQCSTSIKIISRLKNLHHVKEHSVDKDHSEVKAMSLVKGKLLQWEV